MVPRVRSRRWRFGSAAGTQTSAVMRARSVSEHEPGFYSRDGSQRGAGVGLAHSAGLLVPDRTFPSKMESRCFQRITGEYFTAIHFTSAKFNPADVSVT